MLPPPRPSASTGSPEEIVRGLTDAELGDPARVSELTRGVSWGYEPERFRAAAYLELKWRRENGVAFGWHRR